MIQVSEVFRSIQGESSWAGLPCTFIRLTGCNLRCSYCDTAYAYDGGRSISMESIIAEAEALGRGLIEITGGEPLLQDETPELAKALIERGNTVLIETNGSLGIEQLDPRVNVILDIKCPGSGMCGNMRFDNFGFLKPADEVKFVLLNRIDYEWARGIIMLHAIEDKAGVLLSPVFGKLASSELAGWMLEDRLRARLNLQLHKYIFGPDERGV